MFCKRLGIRSLSFLGLVFILTLAISGCTNNNSTSQTPASTPSTSEVNRPPVSDQPVTWLSNGTVSDNEYTQYQQIGDLQVFSRKDGNALCMALRAQTDGYIALGIKPENKMQGADVIICSLSGSQASITDEYSTGTFGPHQPDTSLGGSNDIVSPSGSQQDGWVTFEFKRNLATGDSKDKELAIGNNPVIWSIGGSNDITVHHKSRGYATLILK